MLTERPPYLLFLAFALITAWSLFFPALNWPDEIYKLNRIHIDDNLYANLLSYLRPQPCYVLAQPTGNIGYLTNELQYATRGGLNCYYTYKVANIAVFMVLSAIGIYFLKDRLARLSFALTLVWPSILFYSSSINQQTVFMVVSAYCVAATLVSDRTWPYWLLSVACLTIDRSFISLTIFLSVLMVLNWKPRAVAPLAVLVVLVQIGLSPLLWSYSGAAFGIGNADSIGALSDSLSSLQDPLYVDLALLLLSFVYLGGTNTLVGIGFDYAITFIFLGVAIMNNRSNHRFLAYIYAFAITYFFVVSVIPSLQTFRYYTYVFPALVYFLINTRDLRRKYTIYSIMMSSCYLVMANV